MKRSIPCLLLLLVILFPVTTHTAEQKRVAVLELRNEVGFSDQEAYFLTHKIRDAASQVLGSQGFLIITSESLEQLLPPGVDLAKCTDAKCEVEIGRTIGADYIVTGEIIKYLDD